jgi:hypothetical protein
MKMNKLVGSLIAMNLLLLGLGGWLWMLTHDSSAASSSASTQTVVNKGFASSISHNDRPQTKEVAPDTARQAVSAQTESIKKGQGQSAPMVTASLPMVFLDPDPNAGLDDEKLSQWKMLRVSFIKAIGGIYQNPKDPQYRLRWDKAKTDIDGQLKVLIGEDMYLQLQMKTQQQADLQVGLKAGQP